MKRWYANPYVIVVTAISLMGIAVSSLLFLLVPQPGEILATMQRRMTQVKTFHVEADVHWRGAAGASGGASGGAPEDAEYVLAGSYDRTDPAALQGDGTFTLTTGGASAMTFSGRHLSLSGAGAASSVQFLKFDRTPDRVGALHLAEHRGTWLRADIASLARLTALPLIGSPVAPMNATARAGLDEDFARTPFLSFVSGLKTEKLGGVECNHYQVRPEPLLLKDFFFAHEQARLGREPTAKERQAADTFFADLAPQDGEIWIGKRDGLPHRLRFRFAFDDGARRGTLDVTADLSAYGAPVRISAPDGTVEDITPLLASILASLQEHLPLAKEGSANRVTTGTGGGLGLPVPDTFSPGSEDPDHDGLSNALEAFYGTDPANPDTDGDGMNDGDEIKANRNPAGPGVLFDFTGGRFQ
ncbi:MAG: hypothetical protein RLZZ324_348 [Candidatus Parcubacteria bacterium]|jgi:hypothetical protein